MPGFFSTFTRSTLYLPAIVLLPQKSLLLATWNYQPVIFPNRNLINLRNMGIKCGTEYYRY